MDDTTSTRPQTVTIAVIALLVNIFIALVSGYLQLKHNLAIKSMIKQFPQMLDYQYGFIAVGFVFQLFLLYKIFRGRNWARIVALVFFLLGVLSSIPEFLGVFPLPTSVMIIASIGMFIELVAYVLLFTGQGDAWFKYRPSEL